MLHVVVDNLLGDVAGELNGELITVDRLYDTVAEVWVSNTFADLEVALRYWQRSNCVLWLFSVSALSLARG